MKITKVAAVALMTALGFPKSKDWSDDKLKSRLAGVSANFTPDQVPDDQKDTFNALVNNGDAPIELTTGDTPKAEKPTKAAKAPKAEKPAPAESEEFDIDSASRSDLIKFIHEKGLDLKTKKSQSIEEVRILIKNALKTKPAKASTETTDGAPGKKITPKEGKPRAAARPTVPRDDLGCREGSISQKVNAAVNNEWKDEKTIAADAQLDLEKVRGRLYYAAENGIFEYRRLIQYRRKQATEETAAPAAPSKKAPKK